jgi:hypothetical protein
MSKATQSVRGDAMELEPALVGRHVTVMEVDHAATGAAARGARNEAGLSLREVAKRLGVSAAYCCDLEKGRRRWTKERLAWYCGGIRGAG